MKEDLKTYDTRLERKLLRILLNNKNALKSTYQSGRLSEEHFTDLFHKSVYTSLFLYYMKYNGVPTNVEQIESLFVDNIVYVDDDDIYESRKEQRRIWNASLQKLIRPTKYNSNTFEANLDLLERYRQTRVIQSIVVEGHKMLSNGSIAEAHGVLTKKITNIVHATNSVQQGNIVDDMPQHLHYLQTQREGEAQPIKTGIKGIKFYREKIADVSLDKKLGGGIFKGELVVILGETSVGKSFALMELAYYAARYQKMNVLFVTIEMSKQKQQWRLYSRMTGIPYNRFKLGTLTKKDLKRWKRMVRDWKEHNFGIIEVVAMDNATATDIETKLYEAQTKYEKKFDLLVVDYLNDMKAEGYDSQHDWQAMGHNSWQLAQLAKRFDQHRQVCVVTANQKKTGAYGKGETSIQDAAFSPLVAHHATIVLGIGMHEDDKQTKRLTWTISKNRDDERDFVFYTLPRFDISRIYSTSRARALREGIGSEI